MATDTDRLDDAGHLHSLGYTRRAVWAKWVLDDFKALHYQLTERGEPLEDDGKVDSAFYLDADEWDDIAAAARRIADLSVLIAVMRRQNRDE